MCRMLGVVSLSARSFELLLEEAPRSIAVLSGQHPDGWGIAVGRGNAAWTVRHGLLRAGDDRVFHSLSAGTLGDVIVAHVRKRTRGTVTFENTHPFVAEPWVFTHNGTVEDVRYLETNSSAERRAQVRGETDSERLLAFLLTRLDDASVTNERQSSRIDRTLRRAVQELSRRAGIGTASFLLSNGHVLYAYRLGAPLHLLKHAAIRTSEAERPPCVAVTTEPITDEHWTPIADRELVRIDREPKPDWTRL
jgi:predicted glutamine amidotransferase